MPKNSEKGSSSPWKTKNKRRGVRGVGRGDLGQWEQDLASIFSTCGSPYLKSNESISTKQEGLRKLLQIINATTSEELIQLELKHILWSALGIYCFFKLNLTRTHKSMGRWMRRRCYERARLLYADLMEKIYQCELDEDIILFVLDFLSEHKLWRHEHIAIDVLSTPMAIGASGAALLGDMLDRLILLGDRNEQEVRHIIHVLYDVLNSYFWPSLDPPAAKSITRLLKMYRAALRIDYEQEAYSVVAVASTRKGFEVAIRRVIEHLQNSDLMLIIAYMVEWVTDYQLGDETILDFGSVLEHAAIVHHSEQFKLTFTHKLFDNLFDIVCSERRVVSHLGNRILHQLLDRHDNRLQFETPKIFFQNTHFNINVCDYMPEDKDFLKKHRPKIHDSIMRAILKHAMHRVNLESIYTTICLLATEVPCGYTAAVLANLVMNIQEAARSHTGYRAQVQYHLHALVMGVLSLLCWLHNAPDFYKYVNKIINLRAEQAPHLNPPLRLSYMFAQHHVLWGKPELFFDDWEVRYSLWMRFKIKDTETFLASRNAAAPPNPEDLETAAMVDPSLSAHVPKLTRRQELEPFLPMREPLSEADELWLAEQESKRRSHESSFSRSGTVSDSSKDGKGPDDASGRSGKKDYEDDRGGSSVLGAPWLQSKREKSTEDETRRRTHHKRPTHSASKIHHRSTRSSKHHHHHRKDSKAAGDKPPQQNDVAQSKVSEDPKESTDRRDSRMSRDLRISGSSSQSFQDDDSPSSPRDRRDSVTDRPRRSSDYSQARKTTTVPKERGDTREVRGRESPSEISSESDTSKPRWDDDDRSKTNASKGTEAPAQSGKSLLTMTEEREKTKEEDDPRHKQARKISTDSTYSQKKETSPRRLSNTSARKFSKEPRRSILKNADDKPFEQDPEVADKKEKSPQQSTDFKDSKQARHNVNWGGERRNATPDSTAPKPDTSRTPPKPATASPNQRDKESSDKKAPINSSDKRAPAAPSTTKPPVQPSPTQSNVKPQSPKTQNVPDQKPVTRRASVTPSTKPAAAPSGPENKKATEKKTPTSSNETKTPETKPSTPEKKDPEQKKTSVSSNIKSTQSTEPKDSITPSTQQVKDTPQIGKEDEITSVTISTPVDASASTQKNEKTHDKTSVEPSKNKPVSTQVEETSLHGPGSKQETEYKASDTSTEITPQTLPTTTRTPAYSTPKIAESIKEPKDNTPTMSPARQTRTPEPQSSNVGTKKPASTITSDRRPSTLVSSTTPTTLSPKVQTTKEPKLNYTTDDKNPITPQSPRTSIPPSSGNVDAQKRTTLSTATQPLDTNTRPPEPPSKPPAKIAPKNEIPLNKSRRQSVAPTVPTGTVPGHKPSEAPTQKPMSVPNTKHSNPSSPIRSRTAPDSSTQFISKQNSPTSMKKPSINSVRTTKRGSRTVDTRKVTISPEFPASPKAGGQPQKRVVSRRSVSATPPSRRTSTASNNRRASVTALPVKRPSNASTGSASIPSRPRESIVSYGSNIVANEIARRSVTSQTSRRESMSHKTAIIQSAIAPNKPVVSSSSRSASTSSVPNLSRRESIREGPKKSIESRPTNATMKTLEEQHLELSKSVASFKASVERSARQNQNMRPPPSRRSSRQSVGGPPRGNKKPPTPKTSRRQSTVSQISGGKPRR